MLQLMLGSHQLAMSDSACIKVQDTYNSDRECCVCRVCLNAPRVVQTSAEAACRLQSAKQEVRWTPDAVKAESQRYSDHQQAVSHCQAV